MYDSIWITAKTINNFDNVIKIISIKFKFYNNELIDNVRSFC